MSQGSGTERDFWGLVFWVIGLGTLANGIWMLADPGHWYEGLPAAVPHYGPLNVHFVRDIGCAFVTVAVALIWAARRPEVRFPLVTVAALFLGAHALLHIHDTSRGIVESHHWLMDLPGVYLPAVVLAVASYLCARDQERTT